MSIELTQEQQRRIQAAVDSGAYPSAEAALNAAVSVVELAAEHSFEGADEELEQLLAEGLASTELSEEEFWATVDRDIAAMIAGHKARPRR